MKVFAAFIKPFEYHKEVLKLTCKLISSFSPGSGWEDLIPAVSGHSVQVQVRNVIMNNAKNFFVRTGFILFLNMLMDDSQNQVA